MPKEKILIVEDDKHIVKLIDYNLGKAGFDSFIANDAEGALSLLEKQKIDLIILDIMLPGMSGLEACRNIKENPRLKHTPIIMLTAKGEEVDKVIGFELGADDYITKPFSPRELILRIKAILRRAKEKELPKEIFKIGDLLVDFSKIQVSIKDKQIELTSKEFELLKTLIKANGRVLSRDFLLNNIWGFDHSLEIQTRTVDVHIRTLRKKLKNYAQRITTVKNYGYRFDMEI
ncbi:MAG: response regulator [Candidatus Omnitrophota bacterium]